MEVDNINQVVRTSLDYLQYLQELNSQNLASIPNAQQLRLTPEFSELLATATEQDLSGAALRALFEDNTTSLAAPANLDQLSVAAQLTKGRYTAVAEGYSKVLSLYRTAIGKE
ncbi:MAG: hypothetical protein AAF004_08345 [Pseudomonadota bacterium]